MSKQSKPDKLPEGWEIPFKDWETPDLKPWDMPVKTWEFSLEPWRVTVVAWREPKELDELDTIKKGEDG